MAGTGASSRTRRGLRVALRGLLVLAGVLALLLAAALVTVNTDWGRAWLVRTANAGLADTFRGRIHLTRVGFIGTGGVDDVEGEVTDPAGRTVIAVRGLDVEVGLFGLAWSLMGGSSDTTHIAIESVRAEDVRVWLVDAGDGVPSLAQAFEPAQPSPPGQAQGRTTVAIDQIRLRHVWAHGELQGTLIDVDLGKLMAGLEVDSRLFVLHLERSELWARALPTNVTPRGRLSGRLALPLDAPEHELAIHAHFRGTAWRVPGEVSVSLRDGALSGAVTAREIPPERLSSLLSLEHVQQSLALEAQLSGTLDKPHLALDLDGTTGKLGAELTLDRSAGQFVVAANLEQIDLSLWDPALPPSQLNVSLEAQAGYSEDGQIGGKYQVRVAEARLQSTQLPDTELNGDVQFSDSRHYDVSGTGTIDEPGALTRLRYGVSASGGSAKVHVHGATTVEDPSRLAGLVADLRVRGHLNSDLDLDTGSGQLVAQVGGHLAYVRAPKLRATDVELDASAEGTSARPHLVLNADFGSLVAQEHEYHSGRIRATGTPRKLVLRARAEGEGEPRLELVAQLVPRLEVRDLELALGGDDQPVKVRAGQLQTAAGALVARDVSVTTEHGRAQLSFEYDTRLRSLDLTTDKLNVAEMLGPLHLEGELPRGVATLRARLERTPSGPRGFVKGRVTSAGYGPVDGVSATVDAELERGLVSGSIEGSWQDSWLDVDLDSVPYAALPAARLDAITGRADVEAEVRLENFEPLLGSSTIPIESIAGRVSLDLAWRQLQGKPARLDAAVSTDGLKIVSAREPVADNASGAAAEQAAPWALTDADFDLDLSVDESKKKLSLQATMKDELGDLAKTSTRVRLPAGRNAWDYEHWLTGWKSAEFDSNLWVLPRRVSKWPSFMRLPQVDGVLSLTLGVRGTYRSPEARFMASVEHFGAPDDDTRHLDVMASGDYARERGALRVEARDRGRRVLDMGADWRGDALGHWQSGLGLRQLKVAGTLDQLPTSALPLPGTQRLMGPVSGGFSLEGVSGPWKGNLMLAGRHLNYAGLGIERLRLNGTLDGGRLDTTLQVSGDDLGSVDAEIAGLMLGASGEGRSPARAKVKANDFQLRALRPLVSGTVSGLEGIVQADVSGVLSKTAPELSGQVELRDGSVQLPQLGQMFQDIQAKVSLHSDRMQLERFSAKGLTGALHATGDADLDGLALRSAEARLTIHENEKLPLTLEGVSMGDAWGQASVRYRPLDERRNRLDVDVDEFHLDLPEVTPRGVQNLDPAPHVDVGFFRNDGKFVQIPLQPIERQDDSVPDRWILRLRLGSVEVKKGPGVEIGLEGDLKARVGKNTRWTGQIDLTGGTLDVSGKQFTIEEGTISFDHAELESGVVTARARWDSPLEYTVYAEYAGTIEQGELQLRSEPPLTQDEILGLILFGTPGGSFGAREKNEAATAVGIAGSTVTRGLNRALADFSQLDVSTRVDTSTGEARPELVVQISPRVTARVTQAIGEAPPGQSPDRTFLTVDLRLFRRWSVAAQVGDEGGSSLELIWRRRY